MYRLLSTLRKAGRTNEGLLLAKQTAAAHKDDPDAWNWLAVFQLDLGDLDAALESDQRALALKPDQPRTRLAMGKMFVTMREFEKATDALQSALKTPRIRSSSGRRYPLLGKGSFWTGKYSESVSAWEKAVGHSPTLEYRYYLAQALFYAGQKEAWRARSSIRWPSMTILYAPSIF